MELVYENYERFINDNSTIFGSPSGIHKLHIDDGLFEAYLDTLTDGIDNPRAVSVCKNICKRQKEYLLETSTAASTQAMGWTVMSYAMITDIYREPIISEIMNPYPVDKPMISIPRARVKSQTRSYDGSTVEESYIPTGTKRIGSGLVAINVAPNSMTNIFTTKMLNPDEMRMNRRYTTLVKLNITERDASNAVVATFNVDVNIRPDSRNQLANEFQFEDVAAEKVDGNLNGTVNYDKGIVQFNVVFLGGTPGHTYECNYGEFGLRFIPRSTMNGRTRLSIMNEVTDITIDPNEDFIIDITEEEMQDYSAIFKIDIIRTLSDVIKRQILLNKDFELAYFLKAAENDMKKYGAALVHNLDKYVVPAYFTPGNVIDVFKSISPVISTLFSLVRRNFGMEPAYMLTGLKTAAMLRSMQDLMSVNLPDLRGEIGFSGATAQFMKMKVLESYSIDESKIYMVTKPSNGAPQYSSIVDFVFQPLYVIKELTDGNTRQYVRSRTSIEIIRTDGMGVLTVTGLDKFLGY